MACATLTSSILMEINLLLEWNLARGTKDFTTKELMSQMGHFQPGLDPAPASSKRLNNRTFPNGNHGGRVTVGCWLILVGVA